MNKKWIVTIAALVGSVVAASAAPKISGSLRVVSPSTGKEVSSVRVGRDVRVILTANNLDQLANRNATLNYAFSVVPKGSSSPTTISGKISAKVTLPASEGGAKKTKEGLADLAGKQTASGIITIPDFIPVGVASLSVTLTTQGAGTLKVNKKLKVTL